MALQQDTKALIKDLPFEGGDLFSNTADTVLQDLDMSIKASRTLRVISSARLSKLRQWPHQAPSIHSLGCFLIMHGDLEPSSLPNSHSWLNLNSFQLWLYSHLDPRTSGKPKQGVWYPCTPADYSFNNSNIVSWPTWLLPYLHVCGSP